MLIELLLHKQRMTFLDTFTTLYVITNKKNIWPVYETYLDKFLSRLFFK
jgi:hypothetical protein